MRKVLISAAAAVSALAFAAPATAQYYAPQGYGHHNGRTQAFLFTAADLGISAGTVKSQTAHGLASLRRYLDDLAYPLPGRRT